MALEVTSLIYPSGVIRPEMLPGDVLIRGPDGTEDGTVDVWLAEAEDATNNDAAQRAYVYSRYYRTIVDRLANEYSSHTEGRVSRGRSSYQIDHFNKLADTQDALYLTLTTPVETPVERPKSSWSTKVRVEF